MLLLVKVNLILEKQGCKKDMLVACGSGHVMIFFTLFTKVVILYI